MAWFFLFPTWDSFDKKVLGKWKLQLRCGWFHCGIRSFWQSGGYGGWIVGCWKQKGRCHLFVGRNGRCFESFLGGRCGDTCFLFLFVWVFFLLMFLFNCWWQTGWVRIVMQKISRWFGERFYHFPLQSDVKLHFVFYEFETFPEQKRHFGNFLWVFRDVFFSQGFLSMKHAPWNKQFRA